ncbi:MAG: ATP-binding cassette domain-containing protein [Firmicutes bacterium]|nr:ATP-binding cassette domain-containing protein [Bacillota bacterium]
MLEVRHLHKTYRSKGAPEVQALVDVSVKFESTGMVFVLGKSGSGKSTFLNVVGGLDKYDAGEIIIKGKSSGTFNGSDFDSYRNTYLGFIFQEYNIIEEFTIERNIALALELQNRKATREDVDRILQMVDLGGYGDRKPTQISGGQRQRVAIARAFIKEPEIIFADEPTGALDSATGAQIFETLQKLSQDKLVVVVSHDREFAELYGDRIIEFKDGRLVSDMIKSVEGDFSEQIKNVDGALASTDVIRIPAGTVLTQKHFELFESLAAGGGGDIIISKDQGLNKYFADSFKPDKKRRGKFVDTKEEMLNLHDNEKPFALIKSRLPARDAMRMARSSMKHKVGRLVFSIIIMVLAVTFFGFSSVVGAFSESDVVGSVMRDNSYHYIAISKAVKAAKAGTFSGGGGSAVTFDARDRNAIAAIAEGWGELIQINYSIPRGDNTLDATKYSPDYFTNNFCGAVASDNLEKMGFDISAAYGRYPAADNEILISNYVAEHFLAYGIKYYEGGSYHDYKPVKINDVLNFTINLSSYYGGYQADNVLKIVGIINFKIGRYDDIRDPSKAFFVSKDLSDEFGQRRTTDIAYIYGSSGLKELIQDPNANMYYYHYNITAAFNLPGMDYDSFKGSNYPRSLIPYSRLNQYGVGSAYYSPDGSQIHEPQKGEVIINLARYYYYKDVLSGKNDGYYSGDISNLSLTKAQIQARAAELGLFEPGFKLSMAAFNSEMKIYYDTYYEYYKGAFKIIGVSGDFSYDDGICAFNDKEFEEEIVFKDKSEYIFVYLKDNAAIQRFCNAYIGEFKNPDFKGVSDVYIHMMPMSMLVSGVSQMFGIMGTVFLWMAVALCVFSALLLLNFISVSVVYKRKEIGILRAIGARKADVVSIFLWEGIFIGLWILAFSVPLVFAAVLIFNNLIGQLMGLPFTLLFFGFLPLLYMMLVCFGTIAIASILPVRRAAGLKPMDAIRGK